MQARRMEIRSFVWKGETIHYPVLMIDPCPPPSEEEPYAAEGRARSVVTGTAS